MFSLMNRSDGSIRCPVFQRAAVVLAVAILAGTPVAVARPGGKHHEVREAVSAFSKAYVAADVEALEDLLSDDYIHVNGGSGTVLDRESWLHWISQRRENLDAGRLLIDQYEVGNVEIRIHGETAVVVGSVISRERRNGEEFENRLRFTNVWVREAKGWRRAAFHDSPLQ